MPATYVAVGTATSSPPEGLHHHAGYLHRRRATSSPHRTVTSSPPEGFHLREDWFRLYVRNDTSSTR
uniref:Uncharacterized protein n=1 Tax=Oryza nivara TaxID=4536 RepID=A0A0E0J3F6_ORYNI